MIEKFGASLDWQTTEVGEIKELKLGELHLWWLPLKLDASQIDFARSLLSDIQHDKYLRRASPELQQAYLAGRYYLLHLLAAYANINPKQVELRYSRLNKPSLSHHTCDIEFNFTDTSANGTTHGLFAFTKGLQVGVDIESRERRNNFSAIAQKRFTENELAYIKRPNSTDIDPERFLAIWTRKEAFGKATGVGINFTMNQRDLASDTPELEFFDQDEQAWRLLQLDLGDSLIASIVHAEHQPLSVKAYRTAIY